MKLQALTAALAATGVAAAITPALSFEDLTGRRLAADATCTIYSDIDYQGNDIGSVAAASATDCCAKCGAQSGCGAFTWTDWNGGTCWLKSSRGVIAVKSGARSGDAFASSSPGASCAIEAGVDYVGNDIGSVAASKATDCCAKCSAVSGCNAFTWANYNGGTCYLKSGRGATKTNDQVYSGVVQTPSCPKLESNVDYTGNDVGSALASRASDCCSKCATTDGCGAFTWTNWNGGTCWLKSGKGATTTSSGAVSAVLTFGSSTPTPTPPPTTPSPTPSKCPKVETGIDYVGNDVANVPGSGAADCCTKCGQQAGCGAFTWTDYNGGTCWLKSAKGGTSVSSGAVSAIWGNTPTVPPPTTPAPTTRPPRPPTNKCPTLEDAIDYVGNDLSNVPNLQSSDCCAECVATPGCWAWTWANYNNGTCYLKSGKGATRVSLGVVSATLTGAPTPAPTTLRPIPPRPTTVVPPPSGHVQWKIRSGVIPARAVNLGGWLVAEYWMTYKSALWNGVDWTTAMSGEYITMQKLGKTRGTAQFEQHRQTWITEADIVDLAVAGVNTVRVPVGFWIMNDDPAYPATSISSVYAAGSLKYLDTLINDWAAAYNIAVVVSLHAHQGSQNGNDHSAPQEFTKKNWYTSQANIDNSLAFATFIAARYKNSEAFLGLNLMNEPSVPTPYDTLFGYYKEAYKRIRATGNDCILVTAPLVEQQSADVMQDFMPKPDYYNVWHELHPYFKWGYEGLNEQQIIEAARGYRQGVLDKWNGNPLFLSEWSLGSPEKSAPFKDRSLLKQYASVQLQNYEAAVSGWAFWAWRNDEEYNVTTTGILSGWSMRQAIREGIFTVPRV